MKTSRIATFATAMMISVTPVLADEADDQRALIGMVITMQGFTCDYVRDVFLRDDANTFDIVCTSNEDGTGDEIKYLVTLAGSVEEVE